MQRGTGILLVKIKNSMAKIDFASLGLDSRGVILYLSSAFLFQRGYLYDVISPKIEKMMTANSES